MYTYMTSYTLRELVQRILEKHNLTESDIVYVRLHKKNDAGYVNISYDEFINVNGHIHINTCWNGGETLSSEEFGMRVVLKNGDYLRVWEYDCSTGLEYIDMMPVDNVEIVKYEPSECIVF